MIMTEYHCWSSFGKQWLFELALASTFNELDRALSLKNEQKAALKSFVYKENFCCVACLLLWLVVVLFNCVQRRFYLYLPRKSIARGQALDLPVYGSGSQYVCPHNLLALHSPRAMLKNKHTHSPDTVNCQQTDHRWRWPAHQTIKKLSCTSLLNCTISRVCVVCIKMSLLYVRQIGNSLQFYRVMKSTFRQNAVNYLCGRMLQQSVLILLY